MATDSFRKMTSDDRAGIATDSIDVAWRRLQTSEAYWAGFSGMLVGGVIYSLAFSLFMTVITYGVAGVVILVGGTVGFVGFIGVIGALVFLIVRAVNASLDWPLTSRHAAASAACLTGVFIAFVPLLLAQVSKAGLELGAVFYWAAILITSLQAGAWLGVDRELRKFTQRVAFAKSDNVFVEKRHRYGIGTLLISTFWLAGAMAIFNAADRFGIFGEDKISLVVTVAFCVFLAAGFSVILVVVIKVLRALQRRLFYRKPSVG